MSFNLDRVIAVRTNKTVYRDGDKAIKVFDKDYKKADVLNDELHTVDDVLSVLKHSPVVRGDERFALRSVYDESVHIVDVLRIILNVGWE